ncbi:PDZ domain [Macleaya cordata]|uniref:PDZ domain n=1 Tax=Macleaya cordata TaxID=56857 RepID=A0A200QWK5_MACCD|nr:PDZ domain [Macleaya cordata]
MNKKENKEKQAMKDLQLEKEEEEEEEEQGKQRSAEDDPADNLRRARPKLVKFIWGKPRKGSYRVDTDGSIKVSLRKDGSTRKWIKGGYGAIIRDHNGKLIRAVAGVSEKPVSVLYHQYQGMKKGLELAFKYTSSGPNPPVVTMFINSMFAVHLIHHHHRGGWYDEEDHEEVISILGEIQKLISDHGRLSVLYCNKQSNRAADFLAKRFEEIDIGHEECEGELKYIIDKDASGESYEYWVGFGARCTPTRTGIAWSPGLGHHMNLPTCRSSLHGSGPTNKNPVQFQQIFYFLLLRDSITTLRDVDLLSQLFFAVSGFSRVFGVGNSATNHILLLPPRVRLNHNSMKHLMNRLYLLSRGDFRRTTDQNSVLRILALAAAAATATGTGFLWSNNRNEDAKTTISVSISPKLSFPWQTTTQELPLASISPDNTSLRSGHIPFIFSRIGSGSHTTPDLTKEASGEVGGSGKCCPGCLGRDSIATAAASVGPAVVNISVSQGFHGMTLGKSIGSGTIIDSDGTILTCAHVVVDFQSTRTASKGKVDVTLQDGRTFEGTVVNADFHSDIAVVKIKSKTPLPTAKLGSSCKLRPGDWVVAMGCPLSLQNTITAGIVSCVDRKSSDLGLGGMRREYLQTDCAINEGNSGGPLVNLDGEVVGVNIMKILAADGLSFAVPIDSVSKIIEHFKKNGRVVRPWLGLKMLELNEMIVAQLKERDISFPNVNKGVLIPMVTPGSPADRAGFRPGDVVIEFDGVPVASIKEIIESMGDKVGKSLKVVVKRANNNPVTLTVVPEEANPDT